MKLFSKALIFLFLISISYTRSQVLDVNVKSIVVDKFGIFSDGLCAVKKGEKWGFIDKQANMVIDFILDFRSFVYEYPYFSDGLCMLEFAEDGRKVIQYIDKTGKAKLTYRDVASVTPFNGGFARIFEGGSKSAKIYYIDVNGKEVQGLTIKDKSSSSPKNLYPFINGFAAYFDPSQYKFGFINSSGKLVIKPQFDEVTYFSEGLAAVKTKTSTGEDKWGYVDETGKIVIDYKFTYQPAAFSEGLAGVINKDAKAGYIDKAGNIVIEPKYASLYYSRESFFISEPAPFRNGLVYISLPFKETFLMDTLGNPVKKNLDVKNFGLVGECMEDSFFIFTTGAGYRYGLINYNGGVILDGKQFEYIGDFSDGLAIARGFVNKKRVYGFIDKSGTFKVIQAKDQF